MTCGESVQPLESVNWYISRAHGYERPGSFMHLVVTWFGYGLEDGSQDNDDD